MDEPQNFAVGDHVCWPYCSTEIVDRGTIEWIDGEFMSIRLPDEGKCKVSITAKKINEHWLVYRSHEGFKELLHKD